jgi:hypothetical protein
MGQRSRRRQSRIASQATRSDRVPELEFELPMEWYGFATTKLDE